jgi:serine protease inhibitor
VLDNAELARFSTDGSKLSVDKIAHAALIEVDKEGTEAAAATVVEISFLRNVLHNFKQAFRCRSRVHSLAGAGTASILF